MGQTVGLALRGKLAGEFAQEFAFVHAVLEGFAAIDEYDGDFVVVLAAEFLIGVDIDLAPSEGAVARKFGETFLDDFAEVASSTGVHHDIAGFRHMGDFSAVRGWISIRKRTGQGSWEGGTPALRIVSDSHSR